MNNDQLYAQVQETIKQHTLTIDGMMKEYKQELYEQVLDVIKQQTSTIENMMEEHTRKIEIYIENTVNKRLDALADGYMLTHEKQ